MYKELDYYHIESGRDAVSICSCVDGLNHELQTVAFFLLLSPLHRVTIYFLMKYLNMLKHYM